MPQLTGTAASAGAHTHKPLGDKGVFVTSESGETANVTYGGGTYQRSSTTGTAGAHTHNVTLTANQSVNYAGTSGNTTNANMPAYITCYIWRRTA